MVGQPLAGGGLRPGRPAGRSGRIRPGPRRVPGGAPTGPGRERSRAGPGHVLARRGARRLRPRDADRDRAPGGRIDGPAATEVWEAALDAVWTGQAVWVHGDVAPGNLLVRGGRLSGVIDFGQVCVGDPACDLAIAWSYLDRASRVAFRRALPLDDATWARGRGWSLWKAVITLARLEPEAPEAAAQSRVIDSVIADHREL
ncbi:MAG TPA: phosphotransferase [Caulobacteraceae bacterium]|nr:phosphotransferase [Caulobacteraceae bacterium]